VSVRSASGAMARFDLLDGRLLSWERTAAATG
jgi:hypothetical protein